MKGTRAALLASILLTWVGATAGAQERRSQVSRPSAGFSLEPASPNPFRRETRIPFLLEPDLFENRREVFVSIRIYNLLHQLVAVPRLVEEPRPERRLDGLAFERSGRYEAVWDGHDLDGDRVTQGPYFVQLLVDGRSQVRKVLYVR
ncbi:MAG: hypothetical protein ACE5HP_04225 [Gemmatimonadota bacterium]